MWGRISWRGMGEDELGRTSFVNGEISWGEGARRVLMGECGGRTEEGQRCGKKSLSGLA
ncbi:hypothetical protein [Bartonella tribocorum]|nr:hypothetical protein [Bartonella tribocorum]